MVLEMGVNLGPSKDGVLLSAWVREQHPALLQAMPMVAAERQDLEFSLGP